MQLIHRQGRALGASPSADRQMGHPQSKAAFDPVESVSTRSEKWGLARFLTFEKRLYPFLFSFPLPLDITFITFRFAFAPHS
jgi:hypothetical protein